jgi:hypothetical protein
MITTNVVPVVLNFTDAYGNPIPGETEINIYSQYGGATDDQIVSSGYANVNSGYVANLSPGLVYRAAFIGNRIRDVGIVFFTADADGVTIPIPNYASPAKSQEGFADQALSMYTHGMLGPDPVFGTIVAMTMGAMLASIQTNLSALAADVALPSCMGAAIDSWAADFFGNTLPRFPQEPDASYVARIIAQLSPFNCVLLAIQTKVLAYLQLQALYGLKEILALDQSGALDTFGGLDGAGSQVIVPVVTAFDRQSDPVRSALVGLQPGQVCILLSYPGLAQQGFILGQAVLGTSALISPAIQTVSAPNSAVDAYVRAFVKASGIDIVWCDNRTA